MEQGFQGCETITADFGLRGVVLDAIAVVLIFDAVCDLDIMNNITYATRIVSIQKCRVNSITLLSLMHTWESDRSRIVVLYRFVMNYVRVTAKTATPTKVDSKLSDAHLELLKRREGKGKCH